MSSSDPYDEQLGISFTQNFTSLAYTVTAVEQSGNGGYGPAYLLNGLTDQGYWYQVGLACNWAPNTGFNFIYEVWDSSGNSIFPTNGGGGLLAFSGPVYKGDNVLLKLYFSNSEVVMLAIDENTGAEASETYSAGGATIFVGTPLWLANSQDFFTGLMTEWYHTDPYYGDEQEVVYSVYGSAISSAWMWISEFDSQNLSVLFSGYIFVPYTNPTQLQTLSSNGATVSSDAYEFITGSLSSVALTLSYSIAGGGYGYATPVLTYIFNGAQQTATISNFPTTYYVDIGTSWSVTNPLSSSTSTERWQTNQPTSGTAYSPENINLVYYHQYSVTFGYNINGGGSGYSAPTVTYQEFGSQVTATTGTQVWADSSQYYYPDSLPGSSYAERWATNSGSGLVSSPGSIVVEYYHQYLVTFARSGVGSDFTGTFVTVDGTSFGVSTLPAYFWWNANSAHSFSYASPLSVSSGKQYVWENTTGLSSAQSGSLTVTSSGSVTGNYTTQYYVAFAQSGVDSNFTGTVVTVDGTNYGFSSLPVSFWWNSGSTHSFSYASPLSVGGGERCVWTSTTGFSNSQSSSLTVTGSGSAIGNYTTQFQENVSYSASDNSTPFSAPVLSGMGNGSSFAYTMTTIPETVWLDNGTSWYITNPITTGSGTEQWIATSSTSGTVTGAITIAPLYYHQYLVAASYSTSDSSSTSGNVVLAGKEDGLTYTLTLATSTQTAWFDATTPWSVDNLITASSGTEQWIVTSGAYGTVTGTISIAPVYLHQYHVSVELNPATGGSVSVGSGWFDAGVTFQATASANAGWQFEGWNGSGEGSYSGASSIASTVVGASLVETAIFYPGLTIVSSSGISVSYEYGATAGSVPAGTSQTIFAPQGTNITLTASPTLFIYSFDGWTGSMTSSGSTISAVLNSPLSLTANYSFNYVNIGILSAIAIAAVTVFAITTRRAKGGSHKRRRSSRRLHDKKSKV